jgi:hypothetical protein
MGKIKILIPGIFGFLTVLGLFFVGCDNGTPSSGNLERTTVGKLTITGINSEYNDKWAVAIIQDGNTHQIRGERFFENGEEKGVRINNGQVVLPVFRQPTGGDWTPVSYNGSNTFSNVFIQIISEELHYSGGVKKSTDIATSNAASVTFTNGIGTIADPIFQ